MTPLAIDHLVYAVPELQQAVEALEKRLGVRAAAGGKHVGLGTHNALLSLGPDTYLELIALDPEQPTPERPPPFGLAEIDAPRLVTFAARCGELETRVAAARRAGFDAGRILEMSRKTPDGGLIRWRLTLEAEPVGDGLVPFLIDWGDTPTPASTSPGGCTLRTLRGEHPEPGPVRGALAALGVEVDVAQGPAPRLRASLDTPRGPVEL